MPRYRDALPQLEADLFLTDGGLETTLIFHDGFDLPEFAAYTLLADQSGREALRRYFHSYAEVAKARGLGIILESPTYRASSRWGESIGDDADTLDRRNREAISLMAEVREDYPEIPVVLSACIGSRSDGYDPSLQLSVEEAEAYHLPQFRSMAGTEADMLAAFTMTYADEAIGIVRAARQVEMPVALSFTCETDGCLPTGQALGEAIAEVERVTEEAPVYYMINCAHPTHFADALDLDPAILGRIRGLRANASRASHAELDEAEELDAGDPHDLARHYRELRTRLPALTVLGGCCGTDHTHVATIAAAVQD